MVRFAPALLAGCSIWQRAFSALLISRLTARISLRYRSLSRIRMCVVELLLRQPQRHRHRRLPRLQQLRARHRLRLRRVRQRRLRCSYVATVSNGRVPLPALLAHVVTAHRRARITHGVRASPRKQRANFVTISTMIVTAPSTRGILKVDRPAILANLVSVRLDMQCVLHQILLITCSVTQTLRLSPNLCLVAITSTMIVMVQPMKDLVATRIKQRAPNISGHFYI